MILSDKLRLEKLVSLSKIEGYGSYQEFLRAVAGMSFTPSICTNDECNYVAVMNVNEKQGLCAACNQDSVVSPFVLADIVR